MVLGLVAGGGKRPRGGLLTHQGYVCKSFWSCCLSPASRRPKNYPDPSKHLCPIQGLGKYSIHLVEVDTQGLSLQLLRSEAST
jgi:hypothetical protein